MGYVSQIQFVTSHYAALCYTMLAGHKPQCSLRRHIPIQSRNLCVFFPPLYLQNITNVLCPVSTGSSNIHINNYQPFPGATIEKQHRKMLLIKQLVS